LTGSVNVDEPGLTGGKITGVESGREEAKGGWKKKGNGEEGAGERQPGGIQNWRVKV